MPPYSRASGILLHLTSLPGPTGLGDLGPAAHHFLEFLQSSRQRLWQMLPIGPVGYGNSPYQSFSSFAGNPLFISPERLAADGLLTAADLASLPSGPGFRVDYDAVIPARLRLLWIAHERFWQNAVQADVDAFSQFCEREAWWLRDYSLFTALKHTHNQAAWTTWEPSLVRREPQALLEAAQVLRTEVECAAFTQYLFARQWAAFRHAAESYGVRLVGDLPIFVAHDSADVWANQDLFHLDEAGSPTVVAGVPPDYFSATGQLWGNPIYRWPAHQAQGFAWWTSRVRRALQAFDLVRIDHFRGFESYWEVPGSAPNASYGRWVTAPGRELFRAIEAALGPLPLIAEDLGVITPAVETLRDELGFPGMRVLQFAFGDDPKGRDYRPHNYPRHCLACTGTHDNDTTVGWFQSEAGEGTTRTADQVARERAFTLDYLGTDGREIHWDLIRLALSSVADIAIVPLQDLLGLDSSARMNQPGTARGNWEWRFLPEQITPQIAERLSRITTIYERG